MVGRGTWLGVSRTGRVAFLTNLREKDVDEIILQHTHHRSRGSLPVEFLASSKSPADFMRGVEHPHQYLGFNLVLCDIPSGEIAYLNNSAIDSEQGIRVLSPGRCYGLSNGFLDEWRKVTMGREELEMILQEGDQKEFPWEKVLRVMQDEEKDEELKAGKVEHYMVSSRFIPMIHTSSGSGYYGTRSQTLFCVREIDGEFVAELRERSLGCETPLSAAVSSAPTDWKETRHRFTLCCAHPTLT
jgi:uncharacterized protein with NRDE domain